MATAAIACNSNGTMRWLIVFVVAFLLFNLLAGWLKHIGLGRLPGDFSLRWRGREVLVPLTSSVLLSAIAAGIGLLI
jgi:hypothetical protein